MDDDARLSMAKACLDKRDLVCARKQYGAISDARIDDREAGLIYVLLEEEGFHLTDFLAGRLRQGPSASREALVRAYAEEVRRTVTIGESKRLALWVGFQRVAQIANPSKRGFARLLIGLSFAAEIIAEVSGSDGEVEDTDVVLKPEGCTQEVCDESTACDAPAGGLGIGTGDFRGAPSLFHIREAFAHIARGLGPDEMAVQGDIMGDVNYYQNLGDHPLETEGDARCFRRALLQ